MKKYFWSGNTPIRNGRNTQSWAIAEVDDDVDPLDLAEEICRRQAEDLNADSFILTVFNRID